MRKMVALLVIVFSLMLILPAAAQHAPQSVAQQQATATPASIAAAPDLLTNGSDALQNQKFSEALYFFNLFVLLNPTISNGYYGRGLAYLNLNDFNSALADISRALAHDNQSTPNYTARLRAVRALIYRSLGNLDEAMTDLNEAIRLSPTTADYYSQRAALEGLQYNDEAGLADENRAIQLDNTVAGYYLGRAYFNTQLKQTANAASDYLHWITSNQQTVTNENEMHSGDSFSLRMDTGVVFHIPFTANQGDAVSVAAAGSGQVDPLIVITDAQGNALIGDDDSGGQTNSLIQNYALPAAGTYTLVVSYSGGGATGTVQVQAQIQLST